MDNKEAVVCIRKNWPDERYSMLREALEKAIAALEAAELAPTPNKPIMPCSDPYHTSPDVPGVIGCPTCGDNT
jgi:hypothetical protein